MNSIALTFFADVLFAFVVIGAAVIILQLKKNRGEVLVRGVLAGLSALALAKLSGLVYFRERPFVELGTRAQALNPHNNSFPSDHALIVFAAAFVVWFATKKPKLGIPLVIGGFIVGAARVIAQVHWPLDILGSCVIALLATAAWFYVPLPKVLRTRSQAFDKFLDTKFPKLRR